MIKVQQQDFDLGQEYQQLVADNVTDGAVVTFVGRVRDFNQQKNVSELFLEHYPVMTEKSLQTIVQAAQSRWNLGVVNVIHRFGRLALGDQIVFVGVTSVHRQDAFDAAQYIMDYLKTEAPFWKKETIDQTQKWVTANDSDQVAKKRWN